MTSVLSLSGDFWVRQRFGLVNPRSVVVPSRFSPQGYDNPTKVCRTCRTCAAPKYVGTTNTLVFPNEIAKKACRTLELPEQARVE
jgi:hypothetical protein